ncbi:Las1 family protein [Entamoeba marina]
MTTAWMTWDDWYSVQKLVLIALQTPSLNSIEPVIEKLTIWTSRQIPQVEIEATMGLLQSLKLYFTQPTYFSTFAAMTILRFVNGVVDAPQQSGGIHRSVYQIALEYNVPTVLVEMRHSITHGSLPTKQDLLEGIRLISEYLLIHYWNIGSIEFAQLWLKEFIQCIQHHNKQELEKTISKGYRLLSTSTFLEIVKDIARNGNPDGDDRIEWNQMLTSLLNRDGFIDVFFVGLTQEFIYEIKRNGYARNWIKWLVQKYTVDFNQMIQVLIQNGVVFEVETQQLLKEIVVHFTTDRKIIESFILNEFKKNDTIELNQMEMFIENEIQNEEIELGKWKRIKELPHNYVSTEALLLPPQTELCIMKLHKY